MEGEFSRYCPGPTTCELTNGLTAAAAVVRSQRRREFVGASSLGGLLGASHVHVSRRLRPLLIDDVLRLVSKKGRSRVARPAGIVLCAALILRILAIMSTHADNPGMAKKSKQATMMNQIRRLVRDCGLSCYAIAKATEVDESTLSRFLSASVDCRARPWTGSENYWSWKWS